MGEGGKGGGKPGDWNCPNCGELVFSWRFSCRSCGTTKSGGCLGGVPMGGSGKGGGKAGDWNCPNCGELVFSWRDSCRSCGTARGSSLGRFQPYGKGSGKAVREKMNFDKVKTVWV